MNRLLLPRATALWLLRKTKLTLDQVADFCSLDAMELELMRNSIIDAALQENDPVEGGQLLLEEIKRCEDDASQRLKLYQPIDLAPAKVKIAHSLRKQIPNSVIWFKKNYPHLTEKKIAKFFGITQKAVKQIFQDESRVTYPSNPCKNGLCSQQSLYIFLKDNEQNET
ncbi:MAG: DUF1013 domain-containing protein [Alphaproteobacteria bacterium]|nr:MAG: DUF1013 domain-containing protein [Alphaproteobacteria bacterium]